jgi:acetyltransferase-like isoleucine patch superfamily enzyme
LKINSKLIKRLLIIIIIKPLVQIFYSSRYLKGRFFTNSYGGWYWALKGILWQRVLGFNRHVPWPVNPFIAIPNPENIRFDIDDINIFQSYGCYYQTNFGGYITLGKGTYIAPNVGLITANHDLIDPDKHTESKDIVLGEKCWVGMNSVILPGVVLGDHTVVAAGAVVTKSFEEGWCVIGGVPAKLIKRLDREHRVERENE